MKAIWSGNIKIGAVSSAVSVFGSKEAVSIGFKQLHNCGSKINQKLYCPECDRDVPHSELVKGYEYEDGRYLVVEQHEVTACEVESTKIIDIQEFVPVTEIVPILISDSYYIAPAKKSLTSAFGVIREGLADYAAIGTLAIRNREYLVAVVPIGKGLMMHILRRAEEIRELKDIEQIESAPDINAQAEVRIMRRLVAGMASKTLNLAAYPDAYRNGVKALVEKKLKAIIGLAVEDPKAKKKTDSEVTSVMSALTASLAAVEAKKKPKKRKAA